ncbi:hypothetical protein FC63_GL001216 [Lactobacillus amylovorus DSM 20531]|nr:hypothetical protein FC63_GL001216 [Lactobacillus amylovorus DSM 20531]
MQLIIFPFAINNDVQYFLLALLLVGILLVALCEYRIRQIIKNKDRYYRVIETFKKHQQ